MKFREEMEKVNGEIVRKYYIDDKLVDEKTYFTLSDELYDNIKLPKEEHADDICDCDICNYFLELIKEIRESDDRAALELLQEEFEIMVAEVFKQGQYVTFNELGSYLMKQAARIEDELDDFYDNYEEC